MTSDPACPDKTFMGCDYPFYKFEMEIQKQRLVADDLDVHQGIADIMGGNFARAFDIDGNNNIQHRPFS